MASRTAGTKTAGAAGSWQGNEPKPRKVLDLADGARLLTWATQLVERIEKVKAQNAISQPDFYRLMREMGRIVEQYVPDEKTRKKIDEGWLNLQFFPQHVA